MSKDKAQGFLKGAAILSVSTVIVKMVGLLFSVFISNTIGVENVGYSTVAYDIFAIFNAAATVGLPVAMAKLVSAAYANNRPKRAEKIYSVAVRSFSIFGMVCSAAMFIFAQQFEYLFKMEGVIYSIRALAPTVFFCCVMSAVRGYFQGRSNMTPTAMSQTIEAVTKLLFGVSIAYALNKMWGEGKYSAAGSILGVSISAGIGMVYLLVRKRKQKKLDKINDVFDDSEEQPGSGRSILKELLKLSIPITLGACLLQGINFIDSAIINNRLDDIKAITQMLPKDLYSLWGNATKIFDLPGSIVIALSTSILPVLATAYERKDMKSVSRNISTSLRLTFMITIPCTIGFILYAQPVA